MSWYGHSWLLDPLARHGAIEALETRLAAVSRPGRRWTAMERTIYGRWAQALRRLQLADVGMQILMALHDRIGSVELAAEDVERSQPLRRSSTGRCRPPTKSGMRSAQRRSSGSLTFRSLHWAGIRASSGRRAP